MVCNLKNGSCSKCGGCCSNILPLTNNEKNKRRDVDNITFATKFIQDALVKQGIIIDDSQKYINQLRHDVKVDKEYPRIEVQLIENNNTR